MADELVQAKDHLDAAAAALADVEAAPDVGVTTNSTVVEAVDLEPAAEAARHISDNEVEVARLEAEAAVEQARISADVTLGIAQGAAVEDRLTDILDRLGRLEARAHDHEEEQDDPGEITLPSPAEAVEEIEDGLPEDVPPAPEVPAEPTEAKRAGKLYFGKKRA